MRIGKIQMVENTLKDAMEDFFAYKRAQKMSELTLRDYTRYLDDFLAKSHNTLDFEVLTGDVLDYFSAIPDTSPARFNLPYQYITAFFNWCTKQDLLPKNPLTAQGIRKKRDDGNIKSASITEIKSFLKAIDKSTFSGFRNYVISLVLLDTGMRTSELRQLKDDDFDALSKQITISKNISKTRKNRIAYLSDTTATQLKKYLKIKPKEWNQILFPTCEGNELSNRHLCKEIGKICAKANVKITPYQFRHTFATHFVANGGDVFTLQDLMGHSDLRMTKRYTDIDDTAKQRAHNLYSPINELQGAPRLRNI